MMRSAANTSEHVLRFLVTALQIEMLRRVNTLKKFWETLNSMPSGIRAMYSLTWERINSQEPEDVALARRAFLWVLYAREALELLTLRQALAVCNDTQTFDDEEIPSENSLVSVCGGLITIEPDVWRFRNTEIVRLVRMYPPCSFKQEIY